MQDFIEPIIRWIEGTQKAKIWNVCLIGVQHRYIVPIRARDKAQVGAYIRSHIDEFMIFFEHLAVCRAEVDGIAIDLQNYPKVLSRASTGTVDAPSKDAIALVLTKYSDEDLVNEFYGVDMDGDASFKVCIDNPKELICLL